MAIIKYQTYRQLNQTMVVLGAKKYQHAKRWFLKDDLHLYVLCRFPTTTIDNSRNMFLKRAIINVLRTRFEYFSLHFCFKSKITEYNNLLHELCLFSLVFYECVSFEKIQLKSSTTRRSGRIVFKHYGQTPGENKVANFFKFEFQPNVHRNSN